MKSYFRASLPVVLGLAASLAQAQSQTNTQELHRLSQEFAARQSNELQFAQFMARLKGIPDRGIDRNGRVWQLMAFRDGRAVYYSTRNANAAKSTNTNKLYPGGGLGLSLTGNGIVVGEWDGGRARPSHQEFAGRIVSGDAEAVSGDHATHVGGTLIAAGVNATAKGMAYTATLRTYGWESDIAEMAAAAANGLRISNHSYGPSTGWGFNEGENKWYWYGNTAASESEEAQFGRYDQTSRDWDQVSFNAPFYLVVTAAGNDRGEGPEEQPVAHMVDDGNGGWVESNTVRPVDGGATGYDSASGGATAKNVLTVGAVDDVLSYTGPASAVMSTFSGWGPMDDGRIKPDVVGNGVQVFSSGGSSDTAYLNEDGTSMASPNVCGSLALLIQHYRNTHANADMRSATLKALAIHTARECGPSAGPDYSFGWGLVDAASAAGVITEDVATPSRILEDNYNGQARTFQVAATAGATLKVTICWTDPAGTVSPNTLDPVAPKLVNDLDIRITKDGTTHFPWKLNPAAPAAAATKGDNNRDNVEQIVINNAAAGTYTLTVSAKNAVQTGGQAFSLIITGATPPTGNAALQALAVNPSTISGGSNAVGTVTLTAAAPAGGAAVTLTDDTSAITTPASMQVNAGNNSGTFNLSTSPVTQTYTRQVKATYNGITKTATVTLVPGVVLTSLTLNPTTVEAGRSTQGTVAMSGAAPAGGVVVTLGDNTSVINTPASATVNAGSTTANFTSTTVFQTATATRQITATYQGVSRTANLTMTPTSRPTNLVMNLSTVVGGDPSTGTVTLSPAATTGGALVTLADNTGSIATPASVLVANGQTSGTFNVMTSPVGATATRQITATRGGVTRTANLTLTP